MALVNYLRNVWKRPKESPFYKERLIAWRKQGVIVKCESPTRPDKAHALGYKAKPGFTIVRAKIKKGTRVRPRVTKGRKPSKLGTRIPAKKSKQWICEERVSKKHPNMEVLNSYWVGEDGKSQWFEVILVDKNHPQVKSDRSFNWVAKKAHTGRVYRGLTSAGKKSRGLLRKGNGAEKVRPGVRANRTQGK